MKLIVRATMKPHDLRISLLSTSKERLHIKNIKTRACLKSSKAFSISAYEKEKPSSTSITYVQVRQNWASLHFHRLSLISSNAPTCNQSHQRVLHGAISMFVFSRSCNPTVHVSFISVVTPLISLRILVVIYIRKIKYTYIHKG